MRLRLGAKWNLGGQSKPLPVSAGGRCWHPTRMIAPLRCTHFPVDGVRSIAWTTTSVDDRSAHSSSHEKSPTVAIPPFPRVTGYFPSVNTFLTVSDIADDSHRYIYNRTAADSSAIAITRSRCCLPDYFGSGIGASNGTVGQTIIAHRWIAPPAVCVTVVVYATRRSVTPRTIVLPACPHLM